MNVATGYDVIAFLVVFLGIAGSAGAIVCLYFSLDHLCVLWRQGQLAREHRLMLENLNRATYRRAK